MSSTRSNSPTQRSGVHTLKSLWKWLNPRGDTVGQEQVPGVSSTGARFDELVRDDLKQKLGARPLVGETFIGDEGNFTPDVVVRRGDKIVLVEVKTGNPDLPLPSSANSQMLIMKDKVRQKHTDLEVVPVIVTNYKIDNADLNELSASGIKVVPITGYKYDSKIVSDQLVKMLED